MPSRTELKAPKIASAPERPREDASPFAHSIAEIRSTSKSKMTAAASTTSEFINAPYKPDLYPRPIRSAPQKESCAHFCFIRDSQPPPQQMRLRAAALPSTLCEITSTR